MYLSHIFNSANKAIRRESLQADYGEALKWLLNIGIDYKLTRFDKYRRDIELMESVGKGNVILTKGKSYESKSVGFEGGAYSAGL